MAKNLLKSGTVSVIGSNPVGSENDFIGNPLNGSPEVCDMCRNYDLLITENSNDISASTSYDDLFYSSYRSGSGSGYSPDEDYSEDSNDENNWRNDYPDEDDDFFGEGKKFIGKNIRQVDSHFHGDQEILPDEDDSDLGDYSGFANALTDDGDACSEENDTDLSQNNRLRTTYAKFVERIMKKSNKNDDSDLDSSEARSAFSNTSENESLYLYD
ncbi:uncharacterized protein LOC128736438 [Sabethes cyaneus]|uniref:uncharacterized protein LOC128736438 n=1 Tax=Sabethes cyaneus TaxID=53552 RepID=UPI00237E452E|nr:uncharacterized protein LOC128736438 [Sabethes cyaneus]